MKIIILGEYDSSEITAAPIKVAKSLFNKFIERCEEIYYLPYFQDGRIFSRYQKLFGYKKEQDRVFRVGVFSLMSFVIKFRPQIIHIITPALYYIVLLPLKVFLRFKVISTLHSINLYVFNHLSDIKGYQKFRFLLIEKLLVKYSDSIFVYSERDKRYVSRYYKRSPLKLKVINNGINLYDIKKDDYSIKACLKIAFIGNVNRKEKAFYQLYKVLSLIDYPIKLSIFSHENQDSINTESSNNVDVNVYDPIGEIELRKELAKNDLFILPSVYESYSLSLLEVMNVGLPVIVSSRVGFTDRFTEDMKRVIFNKNDLNQLREKITHFLNLNKDEKIQTALNNINFTKHYSWKHISDDYIKIYNELLIK